MCQEIWNKRQNRKSWILCGIRSINMVDIRRETYERNGIVVDNDEILRLNEKHIEEGLDPETLQEITIKYHSDHRKNRYELVEELKTQVNFYRWKGSNQSSSGL